MKGITKWLKVHFITIIPRHLAARVHKHDDAKRIETYDIALLFVSFNWSS